jgi:hypothetical protein
MHLKLLTQEQFNGDIWRMEIDEVTEILFLEIRDNTDRTVHFNAVNLSTGNILFKDLFAPERWLTGIEAAYDGVLLLHFYQTETGPAHKGLMAIDAFSGNTLWVNYALALDHLSNNGPVVFDVKVQPRKLFLTDIKTGATKRPYQPSVDGELVNSIVLPEVLTSDELPADLTFMQPFGNTVQYLEYNNFRIVSLHALNEGQVNQYLFVFDGTEKVYEDILNAGIQKLQPEAFMFHKNRLLYIKNKAGLRVLSL